MNVYLRILWEIVITTAMRLIYSLNLWFLCNIFERETRIHAVKRYIGCLRRRKSDFCVSLTEFPKSLRKVYFDILIIWCTSLFGGILGKIMKLIFFLCEDLLWELTGRWTDDREIIWEIYSSFKGWFFILKIIIFECFPLW